MEKGVYFFVFFILSIILIIGFFIFFRGRDVGLSQSDLEKCTTLWKNNEHGVNIVFFADKKEKAEDYMNYLLSVNPINNFKDRFNFYYIGDYYPLCERYKDIALLCYSRELVKKAGSCPNDYIVVINDEESEEIRSSSYMNVMSLNSKHPKSVFAHEFGHSFVNFAEEYVPAKIPRNSGGNCVPDCKDFGGKNDGCFLGCSLSEYSRSVENGIMRTLRADSYGKFNDHVITDKIEKVSKPSSNGLTGNAVGDVSKGCSDEGQYYSIELKIKDEEGGLDITNREINVGCIGEKGSGDYSFGYVTKDGRNVELREFNPIDIHTDLPDKSDEKDSDVMMSGETFENIEPFYSDRPNSKGGIEGGVEYRNHVPIIIKVKVPSDLEIGEVEKFEIKKNDITIASIDVCKEMSKGDINGDGRIDISDIVSFTDYFRRGIPFECSRNADVNGDGKVDIKDRDALEEILFGKSVTSGGRGLPLILPSASPSVSASSTASASTSPSASAFPKSSASTSPHPSVSGSPSASGSPINSRGDKSIFERITGLITGWFTKIFGE